VVANASVLVSSAASFLPAFLHAFKASWNYLYCSSSSYSPSSNELLSFFSVFSVPTPPEDELGSIVFVVLDCYTYARWVPCLEGGTCMPFSCLISLIRLRILSLWPIGILICSKCLSSSSRIVSKSSTPLSKNTSLYLPAKPTLFRNTSTSSC